MFKPLLILEKVKEIKRNLLADVETNSMTDIVTAIVSFDSPQEEITYLKLQVNELTAKVN